MIKTDTVENYRAKLVKEVIHLQLEVGHIFGPHSHEPWMNLNLTIGQLKSLFFLAYEGSTNLSKLAEALSVTPPNVTGIVERLVEQGLVSREENPENRRMLLLKLTADGRELIAKLRTSGLEHITGILNQLSDEELRALAKGLKAVVRTSMQEVSEKE